MLSKSFYSESYQNLPLHSLLQGWNPSFLKEPPLSGYPAFSEANLKNYPLFLRAIQIGACKLYETL